MIASLTIKRRSGLILLFLCVILYVCLSFVHWTPDESVVHRIGRTVFGKWMEKDLLWAETPPDMVRLKLQARDVHVNIYNLTVQGYNVHCVETPAVYRSPKSQDVLLLHGTASSSKDWERIGTLQLLATWGHRGAAIDLPGYGLSTHNVVLPENRSEFLKNLIGQLQMPRPLIVAPSVSALYVIPFVKDHPDKISAMVGVSASFPNNYDVQDLKSIQETKMLILYGEKDPFGKKTAGVFENIPNSVVRMIPSASVQLQLQQPETFHRILYNFLKHINDHRDVR